MTLFYPIYIRRSDGKASTATRSKREEPNRPTEEQMNQKPDANGVSDYYREVLPEEAKHIDWRRKLGGMLARELGRKDADSGHILVQFPEHYRLFEHIKRTDGKAELKNKTHAAGGNDRQDAYLYGHPDGRRKRFRSPADFFSHLLWLATDETGDPDNCSCKLCCPEEFDSVAPAKVVKPPKLEPEKRPKAVDTPTLPKQQLPADRLQATPLPGIRSLDQQIDGQYRSFNYRPGEICWFRRGQAWGLGVILRRWVNRQEQSYTVQPLSHPFNQMEPVIKNSEADMRPWLAWSVPRYMITALNDLSEPPRFDTVNWQALREKAHGSTSDLEIDGSILAAKSIDCSYTPFNPQGTREGRSGRLETYYDGIYIGGEKVWLGEPVRLSFGTGSDVLVVHSIAEDETVSLVGDIYSLTTVTHSDPARPSLASPSSNPHLPARMIEDLAARNSFSVRERQVISYWRLMATQQRIGLDKIKGRWYEASRMLPVLQSEQYETMKKAGNIEEISKYLNGRGDCLDANRGPQVPKAHHVLLRRQTRIEAMSGAVPRDAQIVEGVDPPMPAAEINQPMIDPRFNNQNGDDGSLDQFMNLDDGDAQASFEQRYQHY